MKPGINKTTEKKEGGVCRRRTGSSGRADFSVISHTNSIFF